MNMLPWRRPLIQDSDIDDGDVAQSLSLSMEQQPARAYAVEEEEEEEKSRGCNKTAWCIILCSVVVILVGSRWLFLHT